MCECGSGCSGNGPGELRREEYRPGHRIVAVEIEAEHCVICETCAHVCPDVFEVIEDGPIAHARVRPAGDQLFKSHQSQIEDAAYSCCVDIITITYDDGVTRPPWPSPA